MKMLICVLLGLVHSLSSIALQADSSAPHIYSYNWPVPNNPMGVAVDSQDHIWVTMAPDPALPGPHHIRKYDKGGTLLLSFGSTGTSEYQFSQPRGIGVDSGDNIYIADADLNRVQKYDSDGAFLLMWGWGVDTGADAFEICYSNCGRRAPSAYCPDGHVPYPVGIAVDPLDRIWVRGDCNRVQVFDGGGHFLFKWDDLTTGQFSRGWIALDSNLNVFLTYGDGQQVRKFDSQGTPLVEWAQGGNPAALAIDNSDNVYVIGWWTNMIHKFDNNGLHLVDFGGGGLFDHAADLAFGSGGVLYASDRYHNLIRVFVPPYDTDSCAGFEPPMADYPVTVKKNRALPLKALVFGAEGYALTSYDLLAPPVLQVLYDSGLGGEPVDVTDDVLSAGQGTEGNQFVFNDEGYWQFNLKTRNYTAPGTYIVTMESGDDAEYVFDPTCVTEFVID